MSAMMSRVLLRVGALGLAAATVPGVPDSVGFLSSWSRIATALDNRTGHSGGATRYSIMLQGCCDWDSYNLTAPMQLHAEIEPTALGKDFELDFTYDKLYDFFGGGTTSGRITWWWAALTHKIESFSGVVPRPPVPRLGLIGTAWRVPARRSSCGGATGRTRRRSSTRNGAPSTRGA